VNLDTVSPFNLILLLLSDNILYYSLVSQIFKSPTSTLAAGALSPSASFSAAAAIK